MAVYMHRLVTAADRLCTTQLHPGGASTSTVLPQWLRLSLSRKPDRDLLFVLVTLFVP